MQNFAVLVWVCGPQMGSQLFDCWKSLIHHVPPMSAAEAQLLQLLSLGSSAARFSPDILDAAVLAAARARVRLQELHVWRNILGGQQVTQCQFGGSKSNVPLVLADDKYHHGWQPWPSGVAEIWGREHPWDPGDLGGGCFCCARDEMAPGTTFLRRWSWSGSWLRI